MKIELQRSQIKQTLYTELGYSGFLSLFEQAQPLLHTVTLHPLGEEEAKRHYAHLIELEAFFPEKEVVELLGLCSVLPGLEHCLPLLVQGRLEQFHLLELGRFLEGNAKLCRLETVAPVDAGVEADLQQLLQIVAESTEASFSSMRLDAESKALRAAIERSEKKLDRLIDEYEGEIRRRTGLKMIYPWPREIGLGDEQAEEIVKTGLLTLKKHHDLYLVEYVASSTLQAEQNRKTELDNRFALLMNEQLTKLNRKLMDLGGVLEQYYHKRVTRIWHYILLTVKVKQNLCWPELSARRGCRLDGAWLFGLREQKQERCVPLDLELQPGASVLFGANMSGKTTVLKTLFFQLSLVRFGLPLPAVKARLHYPVQVEFMLKTSGDIRQSRSTYSEELAFLARPMQDGAYILLDEMFLSTDPRSGVTLSEIAINSMAMKDRIFFCTTHYPEILSADNCQLYTMEDPDLTLLLDEAGNSIDRCMPYRFVEIKGGDRKKLEATTLPLQLALRFDLPEDMREAIRKRLDGMS